MKNYYLLLLLGVLLLWGCKKDEEEHPEIVTLEASPTSASSCLFKARVTRQGTIPILDYGFVYGNTYEILSVQSGRKISLGNKIASDQMEKEAFGLSQDFNGGSFAVRAYITNEKGTVYGNVIHFTLPSVTIQSVLPTVGKKGDRITITGKNFAANTADVGLGVKFGDASAKIIEATSEKLVVEVPSGVNTNSYYNNEVPVNLTMGNRIVLAYSNFRLFPSFSDFSPKTGTFGTQVIISGDNIPPSHYNYGVSVTFGGVLAPISSINNTSITITVPSGVTTEKANISVAAMGQNTELPGEFTITPPTITSISPTSGLPGTALTITGSNFNAESYYTNFNIVRIGGVAATVTEATANSLTVTVPTSLNEGNYQVTVNTGVHTVAAAENYTVTSPSISSFSPTSGTVGTDVTIQGTFGPSSWDSYVKFGTTAAYIQSYSSNSLVVRVPPGISPGNMKIVITTAGKTITSTENFMGLTPAISSFTPSSGNPGTLVTITGTGFSPSQEYNAVYFGNIITSVISATANSITVGVPSDAEPGAVKISVAVNGQQATSSQNFTVTK